MLKKYWLLALSISVVCCCFISFYLLPYKKVSSRGSNSSVLIPSAWVFKEGTPYNRIITTYNDTLYWGVMRVENGPEWSRHMRYFTHDLYAGYPYSNPPTIDTTVIQADTINNPKILIRKIHVRKSDSTFVQIGRYSPGRFNYLYIKAPNDRITEYESLFIEMFR